MDRTGRPDTDDHFQMHHCKGMGWNAGAQATHRKRDGLSMPTTKDVFHRPTGSSKDMITLATNRSPQVTGASECFSMERSETWMLVIDAL